jgi:hypothetical protein
MNSMKKLLLPLMVSVIALSACGQSEETALQAPVTPEPVAGKPTLNLDGASPGKPQAPIIMSYQVVGSPIVGNPVLINVSISSSQGPASVHYSITDRSALMFQDGQVELFEIADLSSGAVQQLSVVPLREGRLYVNVSAEVQTPRGAMIRSMAIPINVGSAPERTESPTNVVEGPDGEAVISMPAQESN